MNLRTSILRNLILPLGDLFFGQRMMARLKFLEDAQFWPREKILERQAQDLRVLIHIAYHEVPFYRHLMDQAGVQPEDIKTPEDLARLPIVTKDMLRGGYPQQTTRPTGQKTYQASTSGSTGENFYVQEDAYTAGWYRATLMLELEWAGWSIGEPHLQTGMTLDRSLDRRLKDWLLGCHYVSAYNLDDQHLAAMLTILESKGIKHLWGYPGSLYFLARYAAEQGWNQPLTSAVTWGDMLYPHYRKTIEEAFRTRVYDTYGCAEGFHIAGQCGSGTHYHTHDLDVITEYLDDHHQPVPPGSPGSVIITRLHPGPMPLIRYKIGDIAVPAAGACDCGRGFKLMQSIQGRDTDVVLTPDGNRLIVHFFTGILEHFPEINAFQVIQEDIDAIQLLILPHGAFDAGVEARVREALIRKGTGELQISIQVVDQIPLTTGGKRRFIISRLTELEPQ